MKKVRYFSDLCPVFVFFENQDDAYCRTCSRDQATSNKNGKSDKQLRRDKQKADM